MALNLTTADAALKEDYQTSIREQVNQKFMFLEQIEKNSDDIEGRRAILSLHVTRNSGVGARAEGGTLPTAGEQGYTEERVPLRYNYGRIKLSGPVIAAMKSDKGSFTRAVDSESKGVVKDLRRDVNRQLFGTSNGVIATCGTTVASVTVQLLAATSLVQMRQFEVGMIVDIGTVASPSTVASARTITAVDRTNKTITVSGATLSTTSGTHFVFRTGSGGDGPAQKELTGLQTTVAASGTVFNVNPATVPSWVSYVAASVGSISDVKFESMIDNVSIEGGEVPNLIITTDGVRRAYSATLTSQKRFADSLELKGGFKALSVSAGGEPVALTWDRDCPAQTAFVVNTSHFMQFQMSDWNFADDDGAVLSRVSGEDAFEAYLRKYHELATDKRNAHGIMTGITEVS